ncbi:MAG: hypothetical protein KJ072_00275 [Verrucomicrobia bacterium]|nr:hypothetical protein [Verrucomicrobiota bacterium]
MTHAELRSKVEEGIPFTLHVADGRSYEVPHRDFFLLPRRSTVIVVAEDSPDNPNETITHTIPLLMVSGVTQRVRPGNGS